MHILTSMRVIMAVVMAMVMVAMLKAENTDEIDSQTSYAHG